MVEEVRRQFNTIPGLMEGSAKPDYATCVKISTDASIKEMIPPGALVMLTPLIVGTFFGVETLSGVLAGSLVSGVQVLVLETRESHIPILQLWESILPIMFCMCNQKLSTWWEDFVTITISFLIFPFFFSWIYEMTSS